MSVSIVDRGGVEKMIRLQLDDKEIAGLQNSARILKDTIAQLEF